GAGSAVTRAAGVDGATGAACMGCGAGFSTGAGGGAASGAAVGVGLGAAGCDAAGGGFLLLALLAASAVSNGAAARRTQRMRALMPALVTMDGRFRHFSSAP